MKWSGVVQEASNVVSLLHIIHVLSLIVRSLGKSPPDNKLGLLFLFEFNYSFLNNHVNMQFTANG